MRARLFAIGIALVPMFVQCADPTGIRVSVFAEIPCDRRPQVAIGGGPNLASLNGKAPASTSTVCNPDSAGSVSLGDIVLTPTGDRSEEVAFAVMTRIDGQPPETCSDPANTASCIVARRQIRFSPNEILDVRVDMRLSCLGIPCPSDQTCIRGACVTATTSSGCEGLCDEKVLESRGVVVPINTKPLAAGSAHTCAVTNEGGVKCWGDNSHGEIGDASFTERHTPTPVKNLTSGVRSLVAGLNFTCAQMTNGTVKCWGKNDFGIMGNGQNTDTAVPVDVQGVSGVRSLAAGCKHVCAVLESGKVKCWGWNSKGQLGDGTTTNRNIAVDVPDVDNATFITAGLEFTCAGTPTGARCWGQGTNGELGNGTTADNSRAVDAKVLAFPPRLLVAGGNHVFAYGLPGSTPTFTVWGQAFGTAGLKDIIDDAGGGEGFGCILREGGVKCWGTNNGGVLGDGTITARTDLVTPNGLDANVARLHVGYTHSCVMMVDGKMRCWGINRNGELGNDSTVDSNTPIEVRWP